MAKDSSSLIVIAGIGALAWYGYEQGWFANLFPSAVTSGGSSGPVPCNPPGVLTNGVCVLPAITSGSNPPVQQTGGGSPPAPPAPPVTTPPTPSTAGMSSTAQIASLKLLAQAASEGNTATTLNADQWNYYYNHVPSFQPSVNGAAVNPGYLIPSLDAIFFPNGRPANNASYTQYTAAQFIAALEQAGQSFTGLSGLGNYPGIHMGLIHHGRYA